MGRLKTIAVIAFGALVLGCAQAIPAPSARVTITGSPAAVEQFVATERERNPQARVNYRKGAGEARFEASTGDEAVHLANAAINARLTVSIETSS
jgi:hypothetical protein